MAFQIPSIYLVILSPVLIIMGWGMLIMLLEFFIPEGRKGWYAWLSLVGIVLAFVQTAAMWGYEGGTFTPVNGHPMVVLDNYATFLNLIFLATGALTILLSVNYLERTGLNRPEFYMLLLFSISGMMLMGMANDLILVFLALEILSIPLYIMSGLAWPRTESEESAMKYFLLGAFSSGIFVFGIALTYGATGSTALPEVLTGIASGGSLGFAGVAFLLVGLGFKVGAAPFHMWTPDVYEGAPTIVTAFMSVGAKVGGFAAMLRVLLMAMPEISGTWVPAVAGLAALTLIVGNVVALMQTNIKRMLAYSSIAHAGYIMIAVAASGETQQGVSAALFYMFAYLFTNMGAFAVVMAMERKQGEGLLLDDYKGLAKQHPVMALVMAYFMLSLTGVPPTGGFSGKFYIFRAAIEATKNGSDLIWLVIIGVITSVISGYYYLRVVYLMYMTDGKAELTGIRHPAVVTAVLVTVIFTLFLGFAPGTFFDVTREVVLNGVMALAGG
ncbi:MAG: NADH-quinone oxidoreductase subunit N [Ardenticatenaceae bacterium]|nr:NADH-quinone oxidoreductase subunit N [Anaerolineales bacterium]MCB8920795.1 NADH-quinone oxidoreductase subunit N [Ardenticatenaceae bacterium]MCB8989754.1 NADH-quinone oxidoreductase subunit N [Ardenticatenaceae bacterium]MCB9002787.1 NADH-quinone oxidoreductase subunit N [Ardenticatenaceae bacterium]